MRFLTILFLVVLHREAAAQSEMGLPLSTHYDLKIKEASSTWKIFEQPNGCLYIAAELILAQYDGTKFRPIGNCQAASLAVDHDGTAYVGGGGEFGMVEIDNRGKQTYRRLSHLLTDSSKVGAVRYVWLTSGSVYFCTVEAIFEYNKKTKEIKAHYPESNGLFFNGFVLNDEFYISQSPVGLQKIVNGKLVFAPHGQTLKDRVYGSMDYRPGERLLGYGRSGNLTRYFSDPKKAPVTLAMKSKSYLEGDVVYSCYPISKKYFVLGTVGHGSLLVDSLGKVINRYNDSTFFQDRRAIAVMQDRTQNLWLGYYGTQGKVSKTELGLDISLWNKNNGLTGSVVASTRHKGIRYVGTDNNLFYISKKNQAVKMLPTVCRFLQFVNFKAGTEEKLLAITDTFQKIFEVNGTTVKEVFSGLEINTILQSTRNPNRLFVSMRDTLLALRYNNGRFVREGVVDLTKGNYRQLLEDEKGTLWLLEYNNFGITRMEFGNAEALKPKTITRFTPKDGLPDYLNVIALFDHQVIIGSKRGLSRFNYAINRFEPYGGLGKRFYNAPFEVQGLQQSKNGAVYVLPSFPSEKNEIVKITFNPKGDTTYESRPFKRLPEFGFFSELNVEGDVVWISGTEGLVRYDPGIDTKNYDLDFQCLIRSAVSAKDTLLWGGLTAEQTAKQHVILPYHKNTITLEFAAPFFDNESKTVFASKLEGADEEWTDWDRTTLRNYSRLSEGDYTFRVKAKNVYGRESTVATYSFTVEPPWFRAWWAYTIYGFGAFLFVFGVVRWRTYSLHLKKKALEATVKEKTKELIETNKDLEASQEELKQNNEELIAINEHLKATHRQLVATEKMASLGQLTAGIAHEINNPMNFISGGVQALQEVQNDFWKDVDSMTKEDREQKKSEIDELMHTVVNGVKRASNIIKGLRTFSSPVDSISDDIPTDINECIETALVILNKKLADQRVILAQNLSAISGARANPSQLSQVIVNLIDNAIYAVKDKKEKLIRIETSESDQHVMIKVKDNGTGITPEAQKHIFEPFFTTKEVGAGTGLGLFICHTLIQKHNGRLTMNSKLGEGTEFIIYLPKSKNEPIS
jgi:signal transduction histidine kinase